MPTMFEVVLDFGALAKCSEELFDETLPFLDRSYCLVKQSQISDSIGLVFKVVR